MRRVKIGPDGALSKGIGSYTAVYRRDEDGVWIVHVAEIPQCHTHGDSLSRARAKIREALELWVDDAAKAAIADDVRLPVGARGAIAKYRRARAHAEAATARVSEASRELVRRLRAAGISTRDAADVTGLSHQRIAQLASE